MKKLCLALLLLVLLAATAAGMDVVTMVDTSASMFPY
jgi:Mg-chelatase subunit ChlD